MYYIYKEIFIINVVQSFYLRFILMCFITNYYILNSKNYYLNKFYKKKNFN